MKLRILSSVAIVVLLVATVLSSGIPFILNGVMAVIAAVGIYEILKVANITSHRIVTVGGIVFTALFVFFSDPIIPYFRTWLTLGTFLLILLCFTYYLKGYKILPLEKILFALAMTLLVAYFFSAVILVRRSEQGFLNLVLIFLLAWIPDSGAYLCGSAFGKHKLAPVISPKKTIEGAVGGILTCIAVAYLFAFLIGKFTETTVNYPIVAIYAIAGTIISILGDLTASLIKRQYNIKDYGTLIPGHGGIMDRFDSIWFVAPFVWIMITLCPIFT